MYAHFSSHVYHRHSHESYSFGVTEAGAQAFTCRHGRHVSGPGMVMAFNPDDPHDGHAARDGGFTYRMVHIWPEFFAGLAGTDGALPLFRSPVLDDPAAAHSLRGLHLALTGPASELERHERLAAAAGLLVRHASGRAAAPGPGRPDTQLAVRIRAIIHDCGAAADLTADELAAAARLQPVRGLPVLSSGVRARAQRIPPAAAGTGCARAAVPRRIARGGSGRGRVRRPGAPDPLVPALLRDHPRRLPCRRDAPRGEIADREGGAGLPVTEVSLAGYAQGFPSSCR